MQRGTATIRSIVQVILGRRLQKYIAGSVSSAHLCFIVFSSYALGRFICVA